jgi:hypothetical protein
MCQGEIMLAVLPCRGASPSSRRGRLGRGRAIPPRLCNQQVVGSLPTAGSSFRLTCAPIMDTLKSGMSDCTIPGAEGHPDGEGI